MTKRWPDDEEPPTRAQWVRRPLPPKPRIFQEAADVCGWGLEAGAIRSRAVLGAIGIHWTGCAGCSESRWSVAGV